MRNHTQSLALMAAVSVGGLALFLVGFFVALAIRSALADPGPVPNPGHPWTEVEGHGIDAGQRSTYWLGTTAYEDLELRVDGARVLRLEPNATSPNVIAGYYENSVTEGAYAAAIAGGGSSGSTNRVTDDYCTVGGGKGNQAGDNAGSTSDRRFATVGGGGGNTASGNDSTVSGGNTNTASNQSATVGGGANNSASGDQSTVGGGGGNTASGVSATVGGGDANTAGGGTNATVGGGHGNTAGGSDATVGGGNTNTASGFASTVPGGNACTAQGDYSFAAGRRAKANNAGCFVWADSTDADVTCSDNDRFIARASGGVYLYTSSDLSTGAYLASGSGSWTDLSDRNLKDNFTPVDGQDVLARLAEIPISTWNYQAQDDSIRHMGPAAQDFSAAFGLGESETGISTVDADGVALAAIQGLYDLSQEQATSIRALEEENAGLQQQLADLEARVKALEGGAPAKEGSAGLFSSLGPGWILLGGLLLVGLVVVQRRRTGGRP